MDRVRGVIADSRRECSCCVYMCGTPQYSWVDFLLSTRIMVCFPLMPFVILISLFPDFLPLLSHEGPVLRTLSAAGEKVFSSWVLHHWGSWTLTHCSPFPLRERSPPPDSSALCRLALGEGSTVEVVLTNFTAPMAC